MQTHNKKYTDSIRVVKPNFLEDVVLAPDKFLSGFVARCDRVMRVDWIRTFLFFTQVESFGYLRRKLPVHGKYHALHFNLADGVKLGDFFLKSCLYFFVRKV